MSAIPRSLDPRGDVVYATVAPDSPGWSGDYVGGVDDVKVCQFIVAIPLDSSSTHYQIVIANRHRYDFDDRNAVDLSLAWCGDDLHAAGCPPPWTGNPRGPAGRMPPDRSRSRRVE